MTNKKWWVIPASIALIYAFFASVWIALSDYVLMFVLDDPLRFIDLSMIKGWVFVAVTSVLLFILLVSWHKYSAKWLAKEDLSEPQSKGLMFGFIFTALLVPILSGGLIWKQTPLVEKEAAEKLSAFSVLQADQVKNWLDERQGDAVILQRDAFFSQALQRWILSGREASLEKSIDDLFGQLMVSYGYETIEVYHAQRLVKSIGREADASKVQIKTLIDKAINTHEIQRSDLFFDEQGHLHLDWVIPFASEDMRLPIVVVLHAAPAKFLVNTLQLWPGAPEGILSNLLVNKSTIGFEIFGLTPDKTSIQLMACDNASWVLPLREGVYGSGYMANCDGHSALFGYAEINNSNWAIVTQMSEAYVLAPLRESVTWVLVLSILAVMALSILLWMLWRQALSVHQREAAAKAAEKDALLDYISHFDRITGLPNRVLFMTRLSHLVKQAKRENKSLVLLLLDLDRFKDVNDSYGHKAGDELLAKLASRLQEQLGDMDTLARIGGDEFAILIGAMSDPSAVARFVQKVKQSISQPTHLSQGAQLTIGVTIGVCIFPQHGGSADELLQNADAALYHAKADGKGGFAFYNDALTDIARQRVEQEIKLKQAIFKKHLNVFYQPQVDIKSGQIIGAEALIRWQDPEQGLISPLNFIPMAEETGLIQEIGEWVLREVCQQGQAWLQEGYAPLRLAVNVSPQQFRYGRLERLVKKVLEETGFPPRLLELELTESALMQDGVDIEQTLVNLRALGVTLALDDFGTGYSSLAYLKRFALDVIKIDKHFIDDLSAEKNGQQIVNAIVTMGHALGLCVLAEGVESTDQLAGLIEVDCDLYQGFLVSQAIPSQDFIALYRRGLANGA